MIEGIEKTERIKRALRAERAEEVMGSEQDETVIVAKITDERGKIYEKGKGKREREIDGVDIKRKGGRGCGKDGVQNCQ